MIRTRLNETSGLLSVWNEGRPPDVEAADAAEEYRAFLSESGVAEAMVGSESPRVAAALARLPGFAIAGEEHAMSRSWPSGVAPPDMSGVRLATPTDVDVIARILAESFGDDGGFFPPSRLRAELFQPGFWNVMLDDGGAPAAFGGVIHEGDDAVLNFIAVLPEARRRGFGRRLMEVLLAELDRVPHRRIVLTVESDRTPAIRLYERYGFVRSDGPWVNVRYLRP